MLHAWHAHAIEGHSKIIIKTVDSDVVVMALYAFPRMNNVEHLWVEYGSGIHLQYLPIHDMNDKIPTGVSNLLPFFHAFTGADTVSSFGGIGKMTAWKTWMSFREVDTAFHEYSTMPLHISHHSNNFLVLQCFVVLMYQTSSSADTVNEARRLLFSQFNRPIENISPTSDTLFNHLKRAMLQCFVWTNCLEREVEHRDPCQWGWKKRGETYEPVWSENHDITNIIYD